MTLTAIEDVNEGIDTFDFKEHGKICNPTKGEGNEINGYDELHVDDEIVFNDLKQFSATIPTKKEQANTALSSTPE